MYISLSALVAMVTRFPGPGALPLATPTPPPPHALWLGNTDSSLVILTQDW